MLKVWRSFSPPLRHWWLSEWPSAKAKPQPPLWLVMLIVTLAMAPAATAEPLTVIAALVCAGTANLSDPRERPGFLATRLAALVSPGERKRQNCSDVVC